MTTREARTSRTTSRNRSPIPCFIALRLMECSTAINPTDTVRLRLWEKQAKSQRTRGSESISEGKMHPAKRS